MIWRSIAGEMVEVDLRDLYRNQVGILCCPGPSLREGDDYRGWGRVVLALNTAWPSVPADVWVGADKPDCYHRALWHRPMPKFTRLARQFDTVMGEPIKFVPHIYFMEDLRYPLLEEFKKYAATKFCWDKASLWYPIHLALHFGIRKLYLLGCDFNNRVKHYCHDKTLTVAKRDSNQRLYDRLAAALQALTPTLRKLGLELRSGTAESPINAFLPYTDIRRVVVELDGRAPRTRAGDFRHSRQK